MEKSWNFILYYPWEPCKAGRYLFSIFYKTLSCDLDLHFQSVFTILEKCFLHMKQKELASISDHDMPVLTLT